MFARWVGPHEITHLVSDCNYEIQSSNRKTILQINMLKKYYQRVETMGAVIVAEADEPEESNFQ